MDFGRGHKLGRNGDDTCIAGNRAHSGFPTPVVACGVSGHYDRVARRQTPRRAHSGKDAGSATGPERRDLTSILRKVVENVPLNGRRFGNYPLGPVGKPETDTSAPARTTRSHQVRGRASGSTIIH